MSEKEPSKTDTTTKSNGPSGGTKPSKTDTKTKNNESSGDAKSSKTDTTTKSTESSDKKATNYVRGESQKPVTKAYRNNWKAIFGKKN